MEIKKIENCDYVMFPRLQRPGLKPKHVERDAFKAELKHVEGHGDYWLLYQQSKPHLVVHVQLPKSESEFDNILGWCLGQDKWCANWISGPRFEMDPLFGNGISTVKSCEPNMS